MKRHLVCLVCLVSGYLLLVTSQSANMTRLINREHVGVWFNYTRCHKDHNCTSQELREMISLVATRFSNIVINLPPPLKTLPPSDTAAANSQLRLPSLVAEYNKLNPRNNSNFLKVMVTFGLPPPTSASYRYYLPRLPIYTTTPATPVESTGISSYDVAKHTADTANKIFPGTVSTLMLLRGGSSILRTPVRRQFVSENKSERELKTARDKMSASSNDPNHRYILGTILNLAECGEFRGNLTSNAMKLVPFVDVIVLPLMTHEVVAVDPWERMEDLDVYTQHRMLVTIFEDCERKLKVAKPSLKVTPFVFCHAQKWKSFLHVIQCWKMMSDWAKKSGREVLMFEAFDNFETVLDTLGLSSYSKAFTSMGWWQLRRSHGAVTVSSAQIRQSSFIEKASEFRPEQVQSTFHDISRNASCVPTNSAIPAFPTNLISVLLAPRVRYFPNEAANASTPKELSAMIQVMATRFQTAFLDLDRSDHVSDSEFRNLVNHHNESSTPAAIKLPFLAAEHNRQQALLGSSTVKMWLSTKRDDIGSVVHLAESANAVHDGTVAGIVVHADSNDYDYLDSFYDDSDDEVGLFNSAQFRTPTLSIGSYFDLDTCTSFQSSNNASGTSNLVNLFNPIIIVLHVSPEIHLSDPQSSRHMLISKFEDCERKLKRVKPSVSVVPEVSCSSTELLECWKGFTEWARERNHQIIMQSAFDRPDKRRFDGWWRLKHLWIADIDKSSFVEKFRATNCSDSTTQPPSLSSDNDRGNDETGFGTPNAPPSDTGVIVIVGLSIVCFTLVLVVAGLLVKIYRMSRPRDRYNYICEYDSTVDAVSQREEYDLVPDSSSIL